MDGLPLTFQVIENELQELRAHLRSANATFGPTHRDVISLRKQIAMLEAELAALTRMAKAAA